MATNHHLAISEEKMRAALPKLLAAVPGEWRGTTFKNHNLLGRRQFAENMVELINSKEKYTEEDMVSIGNAEDYLRVASNVSATLELSLARVRGVDVDQGGNSIHLNKSRKFSQKSNLKRNKLLIFVMY